MKWVLAALFSLWLAAGYSPAQTKPAARPAPQIEAQIMRLLDQKVAKLDFRNVPVGDVLDFLHEASGLNIQAEWNELSAAGIEKTHPISLELKTVSARAALEAICRLTGAQVRIGWDVRDGAVVISTREKLVSKMVVRVRDAFEMDPGADRAERFQKTLATIQETVEPELWNTVGGTSQITERNGKFYIIAPPLAHRQIDRLEGLVKRGMTPQDWARLLGARQKLRNKKFTLNFDGKTFREIVPMISAVAEVPILIDQRAMEVAGAKIDGKVALKVTDVSGVKVLELLFDQISDDTTKVSLDAIADGEVLIITAGDSDMQRNLAAFDITPQFARKAGVRPGDAPAEQTEAIIDFIRQTIAPDTWGPGNVGIIKPAGLRRLICAQTPGNLVAVAELMGAAPGLLPKPSRPAPARTALVP